ncbi:MAG: hypothetical protein AAGA66_06795, partial [Bacteroidota bacterium]
LLLLFCGVSCWFATGQSLDKIGQGRAFSLSGGVNVNQVAYAATGVEGRRDPYNYFMSGNLNIGLYGWNVPLSFSYSNQNASFQQPFNQYGLSPTYKWITAHLGYRSMTFSRYTLGGHLFLGAGVELAPTEKVKVAAMYGRLQKAVPIDTTNANNLPAYKRMGGGAKVTIGTASDFIEVMFFKAADEVNSINQEAFLPADRTTIDSTLVGTTTLVTPEENLVLGVGFSTSPIKGLLVKGEFASSAITTDVRSETVSSGKIYDNLGFLFNPRVSSAYYQALNGAVQYRFNRYSFGATYERIDPGYRTLGAYYFNNDLENIAMTHTSSWLNQKLNVNLQLGVQRNNLDNSELSSMNRFSTAVAANYQVNQRLTTTLNYSNFSTVVNFRPAIELVDQLTPFDNLDTLNFRQVAQNASSNINYILNERKERRQNLSLNFSFQQTDDIRAGELQNTGTTFYNFNSAYMVNLSQQGIVLSLSGNANVSQSVQAETLIFGPSASMRKAFMDNKLASSLTFSFNTARTNGQLSSRVINLRLGSNYTLKETHQFSLNVTALNRFSPQNETASQFSEFVTEFGYNYNFNLK